MIRGSDKWLAVIQNQYQTRKLTIISDVVVTLSPTRLLWPKWSPTTQIPSIVRRLKSTCTMQLIPLSITPLHPRQRSQLGAGIRTRHLNWLQIPSSHSFASVPSYSVLGVSDDSIWSARAARAVKRFPVVRHAIAFDISDGGQGSRGGDRLFGVRYRPVWADEDAWVDSWPSPYLVAVSIKVQQAVADARRDFGWRKSLRWEVRNERRKGV